MSLHLGPKLDSWGSPQASEPGGHTAERVSQRNAIVRLFAGGCGGTVGAVLHVHRKLQQRGYSHLLWCFLPLNTMAGASVNWVVSPGALHCLMVILVKGGFHSLFRRLCPNLQVQPLGEQYTSLLLTMKGKAEGCIWSWFCSGKPSSAAVASIYSTFLPIKEEEKNKTVSSHASHLQVRSAQIPASQKTNQQAKRYYCLGAPLIDS